MRGGTHTSCPTRIINSNSEDMRDQVVRGQGHKGRREGGGGEVEGRDS